ncbi:hypothetical protein SDJN03_18694, partial [Cucurbita argyrosperma subsp. sororia]
MLDFRMRAQAPEQQEPDIVSHSGPESKKLHEASPPKVEEPSSFEEAAGLKEWGDERGDFCLHTLNQNETWELVPLPEGGSEANRIVSFRVVRV